MSCSSTFSFTDSDTGHTGIALSVPAPKFSCGLQIFLDSVLALEPVYSVHVSGAVSKYLIALPERVFRNISISVTAYYCKMRRVIRSVRKCIRNFFVLRKIFARTCIFRL